MSCFGRGVLVLVSLRLLLCGGVATAVAQAKTSQSGEPPAVWLEPGRTIDSAIQPGQRHAYLVKAPGRSFVHIRVEQSGVDVAAELKGPDGKSVSEMDSENDTLGPEQVAVVAPKPGTYRLEVRCAVVALPSGHYTVTLMPLHAPTEQDRARIAAIQLFGEATEAKKIKTAESMNRVIELLERSQALWEKAGDPYEVALAVLAESELHVELNHNDKAVRADEKGLALAKSIGNRDLQGTALNNLGVLSYNTGDVRKAVAYLAEAGDLKHAVGNVLGEAPILLNLGSAYDSLGEKQKALDCYDRALRASREGHSQFYESIALSNIAVTYQDLGGYAKAIEYSNQALPIQREIKDEAGISVSLLGLGLSYLSLGDTKKALEKYEEALPLWRKLGDQLDEGKTLTNIGRAYSEGGDPHRALEFFEQALPLNRAVGDRNGEAVTLMYAGRAYYLLGDRQAALGDYNQALAILRAIEEPLREGRVLSYLMVLWRDQGQPETAIFFGKQAVNDYQQIRANISGLEKGTKESFIHAQGKAYRDLADLLIGEGRIPEAQQVLELLKDEEYKDFTRRDEKTAASLTAKLVLTPREQELQKRYDENLAPVTAAGNQWATLRAKPSRTPEEDAQLKQLSDQLKVANQAWGKFLDDLHVEFENARQSHATVENLQESASGLQRVVRQLGPGTVALYTLVGEQKYHVILVTPTVELAREYPITAAELNKKVAALRMALLDPKADPLPMAKELYSILLGPVANEIAGANATTLLWSLDGVLRYVPMAALHDGQSFLVEKYRNIVFTPASIPTLATRPAILQLQGLGLGVSKSYGGMSPLPEVPGELHGIIRPVDTSGAGVLTGQTFLDETFTAENLKKALAERYPLVHIASHFVFGAGNDTDSYLLLGGTGPEGQKLTLAEINDDPEIAFDNVELLTLSACNTALSLPSDGREVDGLGMLAQRKGAHAVVATLWSVYDPSTSELMRDFYRAWTSGNTVPKAEALRQAQLELLHGKNGYAHPYYWAPFILIGNAL